MNPVNRKRAWISMWAVVAMMSACGGGGDDPAPTPPPVADTPSPTPTPTPPSAPPPSTPPPPVAPATVSGTVSVLDISLVDSDTNDPKQEQRASNNTVETVQAAANPALVVGYVNQPGEGPDGPNKVNGDIWDAYRVDLVAGQVVELNFGDAENNDIDLYVLDTNGEPLGESIGETRSECIRITRSGSYIVGVFAYAGAATYEMVWGPARPGSTCPNAAPEATGTARTGFVNHELIAKPRTDTPSSAAGKATGPSFLKATALLDSVGVARKAGSFNGDAMLLGWPEDGDGAAKVKASLAGLRAKAGTSLMKASLHAPLEGSSDAARRAFDTILTAKQLAKSGAFEYVELNRWKQALQTTPTGYGAWPPNDEYLSRQPHYGLIDLPAAFDALASLSPRPTHVPIAAVVDSGIVADHPDLENMLVPGYDFIRSTSISGDGDGLDTNPNDEGGGGGAYHGTHVAGTIAAQAFNGRGVIGVAPMARIMPVRALGAAGGTTYDILQAVRFAAGLTNDSGTLPARRADVINLSLGGNRDCSSAEAEAYAAVRQQGVIVVAATGNDPGPVGSPANCANVIAVSAVSYDLRITSYSSTGPQTAVTAPGGDSSRSSPAGTDLILSTFAAISGGTRRVGYAGSEGTSMATPHVAGVMALMRAVNPSLTPAQVDSLLASGALTNDLGAAGRDASFGYGLINALKAVQAAAGSGSTPTPVPDLPTMAVSPAVLDFGSSLTELNVTVTRINGSSETPESFTSNAIDRTAIGIREPAPNPPAGPYVFTVSVDRTKLSPGENVVRVEIVSVNGQRVSFDVSVAPRTSAPAGQGGVGPVYVLAVDVNSFTNVGQADITTVGLTYAYSIANITTPQVYIVAGTDTDNDGFVCGASEPCGLYPVLGGQPTLLDLAAGGRTGVDFDLVSGGASAASLGVGKAPAIPARGFRRVMP